MLAFFLFLILGANILINAFMAVPGFQNLPHRTLYAFPFFVLLLGYGISRLPPRMSLAACGILLLVYGTGIANYFSGQQFMKPVLAVPWRAIFTTIRASSPAGTMVVCNRVDFACPWYARRYGFGPRTPEAARKLAEEGYAQIWWIQSNRGAAFYDTTAEARLLEEISNGYQEHTVTSYALHDPSIRLLKRRFMRQQDDYDYRVNVYMLSEPVTPGDD
jgi:hypothetical protein